MQLIGMLGSPHVRRVAITLNYKSIPFEHCFLSVFRDRVAFSHKSYPAIAAPSQRAEALPAFSAVPLEPG